MEDEAEDEKVKDHDVEKEEDDNVEEEDDKDDTEDEVEDHHVLRKVRWRMMTSGRGR